ncbi:MAG TPA: hypothetical protein VHY91_12545 [Pirellulales bacterium]|nr:hypothetical protein [Pirellulales bacterium]
MDRKKHAPWDLLLPICLALASGCQSRGTSDRPDRASAAARPIQRRAAAAEPRRLMPPIQPTEFYAQQPSGGDDPLFPAIIPGEQPSGPALTAEAAAEPISAFPGAVSRLPADVPVEETPFRSQPVDDGMSAVRQPFAGSPPAQRFSSDPTPTVATQERLPWADERPRSAEMEAIAQSADVLVRQGFRLAERGAVYSARLKFFAALSLIARSLDVEQQTQVYTRSLVAGRTALAEAWDFRAEGLPMATDLARIVAAHRTTVLAQTPLDSFSPVSAQQRYFSYAQEQLALAAGREPIGSLALYGLGKTAATIRGSADAPNLTIAGEQMAYYQAALMVDGRNFRAAHELGVLLAEHGRLETARDLFLSSLAVSENAVTWRNLQLVWARLGDAGQSAQAGRRADHLMNTRLGANTGNNLRWVDPETFAKSSPPGDRLGPAAPSPAAATAPAAKKRVAQWPWKAESRQ